MRSEEATNRFFAVVDDEGPVESGVLFLLVRALDELASMAAGLTPVDSPCKYPEPPSGDYERTYARLEKRFPSLGLYDARDGAPPGHNGADIGNIGDAIDDLADIVLELTDFRWRIANTTRDDAIWHLELGYRNHWSAHVEGLRLHLHWMIGASATL